MTLRISVTGLLLLYAAAAQPAKPSADAEREKHLKVAEIIDAMAIAPGSQVADIGAGDGFYTSRLSRKVGPTGRVYAVDIDAKFAIPKLKKRVKTESLKNTKVIHSEPGDPKLPDNTLDAALMVIMYHEVVPYQEMLKHVMGALKPGGRLVVVDMTPNKTLSRPRADQVKNHVINPDIAGQEFKAAGFEIASRQDKFIDWPDEEQLRWMMVCRRPEK